RQPPDEVLKLKRGPSWTTTVTLRRLPPERLSWRPGPAQSAKQTGYQEGIRGSHQAQPLPFRRRTTPAPLLKVPQNAQTPLATARLFPPAAVPDPSPPSACRCVSPVRR